ncbi:MAG: CidA/LrgA family protein [Oscillospiraceae bacterium]|nr:CidA/LrgA family protein [Oscillospiraceae bacterium]
MKHILQIALIATVSFAGELLNHLLPLPVPGSIYGLAIMLLLLVFGVIRLEQVKETADWLLSLMPVMFVGPIVGLIGSYDSYKNILLPLFIITLLTTVITMAAAGLTTQGLMGRGRKEGGKDA